jgi:peptidylprolyl isomerase
VRAAILPLLCVSLIAAGTEDPVVAERGSDRITVSQARALVAATDATTQHRLTTDPAAMKDFLRNLLLQRSLLRQAAAEKWDQRPDVATLLQRAHDQIVLQSYLAAHASLPAAYPSDAEVQTAYDQNKGRFMQPRSYHLTQLFLPHAAASPEDGRRKLASLRAALQHGKLSFEAAAKQVAGLQPLDMGWLGEPQLLPAVKEAVAGLPEGAISDPLCMDNGCHLIRLVATRPAGPAPLPSVRDSLVRALRQQKQAAGENAYASGLLAKQPVAINEIQLSHLAP